jgi:aspartate aminotransferase
MVGDMIDPDVGGGGLAIIRGSACWRKPDRSLRPSNPCASVPPRAPPLQDVSTSRSNQANRTPMTIKLSARVQAVKPSATLAITARAKELRAAGKDVIGLGAGEPDFDTPDHIKRPPSPPSRRLHQVHRRRRHPELKRAIIAKFKRDNGLDYTAGADPGLLRRQAELLQPGPGGARPRRRGGHPGALLGVLSRHGAARRRRAGAGARRRRAALQDHAQPAQGGNDRQTRLVVINSPSNPTGMAYNHENWRRSARCCASSRRR